MSPFAIENSSDPLEVVIAGGGVAALEAILALHALAPGRVSTHLVAPNREFVDRPPSVAEPFGLVEPRRWDLGEFAREQGAAHTVGAVAAVDDDRGTVTTTSGDEIEYDVLVLATGARRVPVLDRALTFMGPDEARPFADVLRQAEAGTISSIAFAVPRGLVWTLPIYELALMTAAHLSARGARGVELSLATPERAPLGLFGARASDTVADLLSDAGVALHLVPPERVEEGRLVLAGDTLLAADTVVALPRLEAPEIDGVPRTEDGFIPTDLHCRVDGLENVYAAGDATWFPVKQGGIATQQADAAASAIAERAGAQETAHRFRPVIRGALLTGTGVTYLRHGPHGRDAAPSNEPLWWPPAKVAGRYLGPYLAGDGTERPLEDIGESAAGAERSALALSLEAADADADWGDYGSALRWLDIAERLALVLPAGYAEKRERWRDAQAGLDTTAG